MDLPKYVNPEGCYIDFDQESEQWVGLCPYCGEVGREPGEPLWHDRMVVTLVDHDRRLHGADGLVNIDSFIFLTGGL